jgi:uncharacterized membrane protein
MKKIIILFGCTIFITSCNLNNAPENKLPVKLDSVKIARDTVVSNNDSVVATAKELQKIVYDFKCKGNEPFWQVEINAEKNSIDFINPMEQKTTHFNYSEPTINNKIIVFNATTADSKNKISITIINESCTDGMSEKKYNYKAAVVLNDKKYNGCAMKEGEDIQ